MQQFVSAREISEILNVNKATIDRWVLLGILEPTRTPYGSGYVNRFSILTLLAFAVGIDLRKRGFSTTQAGNICRFVCRKSLPSLQADWREGRTLILCVADFPPFPKLLTRGSVFNNPAIDLEAAFNLGVPVAIVDVAEAYRQIAAKLITEPKVVQCPA